MNNSYLSSILAEEHGVYIAQPGALPSLVRKLALIAVKRCDITAMAPLLDADPDALMFLKTGGSDVLHIATSGPLGVLFHDRLAIVKMLINTGHASIEQDSQGGHHSIWLPCAMMRIHLRSFLLLRVGWRPSMLVATTDTLLTSTPLTPDHLPLRR
jgi:hypothetical protein